MVDETNIVGVSAPVFREVLTRARIADGFEKAGIYPLGRSKMMAGLLKGTSYGDTKHHPSQTHRYD